MEQTYKLNLMYILVNESIWESIDKDYTFKHELNKNNLSIILQTNQLNVISV